MTQRKHIVNQEDACVQTLDYIVHSLGGQTHHLWPVINPNPNDDLVDSHVSLPANITHKKRSTSMTLSQWVECMEYTPHTDLTDSWLPKNLVARTPTHMYSQDPETGLVQKFSRVVRVAWSGGLINVPSLQWLPQFGEACRSIGGNTLVICESAPLVSLWRDKCGAHPFSQVSRGSRRAGQGIVGVQPCSDMPQLVVVTQATAMQQLTRQAKSAMLTCHFDRIVLHMVQASHVNPDLVQAIHEHWPGSQRWGLSLATLQMCHMPALFYFLRLRHDMLKEEDLPVTLSTAQPGPEAALRPSPLALPMSTACIQHLFKLACWNQHVTPTKKRKRHQPTVTLNMVTLNPSESEHMLLSRDRRCEINSKFYTDPYELYMDQVRDRFETTAYLNAGTLCNYYGPGDYTNDLQRLMRDDNSECCVCLNDTPFCAILVLSCCHTLCTTCYDRMLCVSGTTKCPQCNKAVPENQEPLLWLRQDLKLDHTDAANKNSKVCWAERYDLNWSHFGGPHICVKTHSCHNLVMWDTRTTTLHRVALTIISNVDSGILHTNVHALLWRDFDVPSDVTNKLKTFLPDGWL